MKMLDATGHHYALDNFIGGAHPVLLDFYERTEEREIPGTTNEEVLEVLIHRLQALNKKIPCRENSIVITQLETARMWLNARTKDRQTRGVEGTFKP